MSQRRFMVSGRVQGVWFRESTRRQAESLEITGSAVNLPDGRVKVLANGESSALDQLERWLHEGPPLARVSSVISEEAEFDPPIAFSIG